MQIQWLIEVEKGILRDTLIAMMIMTVRIIEKSGLQYMSLLPTIFQNKTFQLNLPQIFLSQV